MVQLTDTLTLDRDARICADGCLVAEVFAARTGLQDYTGREVDPDNAHGLRDKAVASVYRPEAEVFKADSLATFAAAPITVDHPSGAVTADNWRALGVGEINGDVVRDGQRVRVPIIVRDGNAVKAATSTHKQLSMGYATKLVFPADGKHPDGTACDAYQTDIRINHIALVRAARGGPELRVVDERAPETKKEPAMAGTIIMDGLPVSLADEAAVRAVIEKLQGQVKDASEALTAKDKQIETLTGEKTVLDQKVKDAEALLAPAELDKRVADRSALITAAKAIAPGVTTDGVSDAAIRKAVVSVKLGDAAKDMSDDAIGGAFALLAKDAKPATDTVVNLAPSSTFVDGASVVETLRNARYA